jgi:hypothetical protein
MDSGNRLALLGMLAEILTTRPDLEAAPCQGVLKSRSEPLVGVEVKSQLEGEAASVPGEEFPLGCHAWFSQYLFTSRFANLPSFTHWWTSFAGTSIQPTG